MLRRLAVLACVALGALARPAAAFYPEPGFYWNPAESGSGYALELQDNFLFLSAYTYLPNGQAVFYTSGGFLANDTTYTGAISLFSGGSCITCTPFSTPGPAQNVGTVTIVFDSEQSANMTWNGRTFRIERFNFLLGDKSEQMQGEWTMFLDFYDLGDSTAGSYASYPYYGDLVIFDSVDRAPTPDFYDGCRPANADQRCTTAARTNHDASGYYNATTGEQTFLVTDVAGSGNNADTYFAYYSARSSTGLNQLEGVVEICNEGACGSAQATYFPMRGFRSASKRYVQTGVGPSALSDKAANATFTRPAPGISELLDQHGGRPRGLSAAQVQARFGFDPRQSAQSANLLIARRIARLGATQ